MHQLVEKRSPLHAKSSRNELHIHRKSVQRAYIQGWILCNSVAYKLLSSCFRLLNVSWHDYSRTVFSFTGMRERRDCGFSSMGKNEFHTVTGFKLVVSVTKEIRCSYTSSLGNSAQTSIIVLECPSPTALVKQDCFQQTTVLLESLNPRI